MVSRLERIFYLALVAVLIFSFSKEQSSKAAILTSFENGFADIAEKVSPVVVNISAEGTTQVSPFANPFQGTPFQQFFHQFFAPQFNEHFTSLGSGMIVRQNGYVLTNAHVVRGTDNISVILSDGTTFRGAKIVGTDPAVDLAILKINNTRPLPEGMLGDSDKIRVGEWAIAIGNPYGFKSTVTAGVVSAKGRNLPGESDAVYHNLIQTDASINPGNSGGALVNIHGEIVGMNTSIATPSGGSVGIGFAIPINTIKSELNELIVSGEIVHGYLGVYTQPLTPGLEKVFGVSSGVLLSDVVPSSPAAKAGLRRGDIILKYDGTKIANPQDLQDAVSRSRVGSLARLLVLRKKRTLELYARIEERPSLQQRTPSSKVFWGLHLKEITPVLAQTYNLRETSGLLVTEVDPGSLAESAGVTAGDVIRELDRTPVSTLAEFEKVLDTNPSPTVLLLLDHQGSLRYVAFNKK